MDILKELDEHNYMMQNKSYLDFKINDLVWIDINKENTYIGFRNKSYVGPAIIKNIISRFIRPVYIEFELSGKRYGFFIYAFKREIEKI
jgi:hypothetical protein